MGEYLFGNRMSTYDCFMLTAISYNAGAGTITALEIVGLLAGAAILSALFTNLFTRDSK